jgi:protein SCO1/2
MGKNGGNARRAARLAGAAMPACALALAACGTSTSAPSVNTAARSGLALEAPAQMEPPRLAPEISLRNSLGQPVRLSEYRGKAVLVTFIYDHCPDVCPLIVANLHDALTMLGAKAGDVQIVAVSVDPRGDTPATVAAFLSAHEMTGRMQYLIGSRRELAPVWHTWGVGVNATPDSREVDHSAFIYGIDASGRVRALYPANFKPRWIAHDVPILASG